jgi:hypothetical protein
MEPAAQVAAADPLDDRFAEPVQQRRDEEEGATEARRDVRGQDRAGQLRGVDDESALRLVELGLGPDRLGQFDRSPDVFDDRDVAQDRTALRRHQRRPDHGQDGVLRALHEHGAAKLAAPSHAVTDLVAQAHSADTPSMRELT